MLFIGLIVAVVVYFVLYWFYMGADATSTLYMIDHMFTVPEPSVFFLLRWLLIITALYLLADFLSNPARRKLRERRQRKRDEEYDRTAFRGAKPIVPPPSTSDDTLPHF